MVVRSLPLRLFAFAVLFCAGMNCPGADVDLNAALPVDPAVKMGALPNGMKYWIRAHKTPPGKVGAWIHVSSGSINEDDNQRGLAHFLEHMAFNGTENFPPGTLVKYFESIGLRFGQHQNAFTGFDQTTYQISLPDTKDETVSKGLQCLADMAFRMSLLPEEIDRERGVILEESRARKGAGQRVVDKLLPILAPGSRLADRLPIGKEEVIKVVDKPLFESYYRKWYRPDNATLIVCGDIDPAACEKIITANFGSWKEGAGKATDADHGIKAYTATRAAVITDPELTDCESSVVNIGVLKPMQTVGEYRQQMIDGMGPWIVNRRFAEIVEKGKAPYQNANASVSPFLNVIKYINADATGKPDQWEAMMFGMLVELKRAREFGFLEQELEDAKKETLSSAEQAARTEGTWDKNAFLGRMNSWVAQGRKPMSEAQRVEVLKALLPGVTLSEVSEAFKKNFAPESRLLLVTMPEKEGLKVPTEAEILAVGAKAEAEKVEPPAAKVRPKSLMEQEPTPGTVAQQTEDADLKILSVVLSNNVRVHLRSMDFKKNQVSVNINVAGGEIRETAANRGISDVGALALGQAATQKLSSTTIREMMTGRNIGVNGWAAEDMISLSVGGAPADLEEGLRLAHLLLTEPKVEESAVKKWREETIQNLERRKTDANAQLTEKMQALLMNNDPRGLPLTKEQVEKLSIADAQAWLTDALTKGPVEVSIVGDIDRETALKLALKYLGSLPRRELQDTELAALRKIEKKKGPLEAVAEVETITPTAVIVLGWRGAEWREVKDRRVLQIAGQILSARLREEIREKRSLTYSIFCGASAARVYEGTGMLSCYFTADPAKAEEAAKLSREIMEKFAQEGPTDAEMDTVRKQLKNTLETQLKEPNFWSGVLGDLEYRGTKLSDVKELVEKMTTYTKEDVMEAMKKYVNEENRVQVIALPKKK